MPLEPAAELWEEWSSGRLCVQECASCRATQMPPGRVCSSCGSTSLHLADMDSRATLLSWSTVHRAPSPEFADQVPYVIGLAQVRGGALIEARVEGPADTGSWRAGTAVAVVLGEVNGRRMPTIRETPEAIR